MKTTQVESKGLEVMPAVHDQVTSVNPSTKKIEYDPAKYRINAELNRERFIRSVEARRQRIASRERD